MFEKETPSTSESEGINNRSETESPTLSQEEENPLDEGHDSGYRFKTCISRQKEESWGTTCLTARTCGGVITKSQENKAQRD